MSRFFVRRAALWLRRIELKYEFVRLDKTELGAGNLFDCGRIIAKRANFDPKFCNIVF